MCIETSLPRTTWVRKENINVMFTRNRLPVRKFFPTIKGYRLSHGDNEVLLKDLIQEIYDEHKGNYGYRHIHQKLRNRGCIINHKKVQRLMTAMSLKACIRRKRNYSSYKGEVGKKADNLIKRQFQASKPYEIAIPM